MITSDKLPGLVEQLLKECDKEIDLGINEGYSYERYQTALKKFKEAKKVIITAPGFWYIGENLWRAVEIFNEKHLRISIRMDRFGSYSHAEINPLPFR